MILLTGAAGFIGSCLLQHLNSLGRTDLILVDDFSNPSKQKNLIGKVYHRIIHRDQLFDWLKIYGKDISFIYHLGARTDTTEKNRQIFNDLNLSYSKKVWQFCVQNNCPLVYASSAATYGLGEWGFEDSHSIVDKLKPLNPYGDSKNEFDLWALNQKDKPGFWAGLKFFNVYGPNEYHKGRMASVVFHTFHQIQRTGKMKLFRSHRPDIEHGQQSRDFIFIQDIVRISAFFLEHPNKSGLYNLGTGSARSFWDLAVTTFEALGLEPQISFIDTPLDIRDTYQYFTEAKMTKLRKAGYQKPCLSLEEGINLYVKQYLLPQKYY